MLIEKYTQKPEPLLHKKTPKQMQTKQKLNKTQSKVFAL